MQIESLDQEGRGIGHRDGKVIFVDGALAGEHVSYASRRVKPSYEVAEVGRILRSSSSRVVPRCPHFGVCGGCSMQHLDSAAQVSVKQRILEDNLWHIGKVRADRILPPINGPAWGYRHRARFSVRYVAKKGGVLVGFHEKASSYVADMKVCMVVPPRVSALLMPLRSMVASLSIAQRLPQIELAIGEGATPRDLVVVLVLRILEPLTEADETLLIAFAAEHAVLFWLQPKGPDTIVPFGVGTPDELSYSLPEFGVRIHFLPTDFTQVNAGINRVLVGRALRLLDVQPGDRVADLFCGLGNFSLPIARTAREVVGIEGSATMTARAAVNAQRNGLAASTSFSATNLFEVDGDYFRSHGLFDRMLVDPPREGAISVANAIAELGDAAPRRIVYVSCNPATLARDAAVLVREGGYVLRQAGIVNMFPQTSHVESIGVFDRP
ncbi:MAG: 23S rRNA (uracil(1939)-C(5))-methyltransferase RlmD [Burkholderiaceae bacterium]